MSTSSPRPFRVLALAASIACAASAQTPTPASSQPTQSQNSDTYKLSVQVKRVILDVVVTDADGNPVEGLRQDDFKVLEDGAVQPIRSFDVHAGTSGPAQPPLDLHLPPNTFSNLTLAPPDKPVTILLYDALNTPPDYLHYAHSELVKFIKDQKSSTRVAIFILTDRLHMLQGFTDNETRLIAAVDDKALSSHTSQLRIADTAPETNALLADAPVSSSVSANAPPPEPTAEDEVLSLLTFAETEEQDFQDLDRIQITAQAFINLARFAASLPGRKNVVWMAGAFPMEIWPGRKATGASTSPMGGAGSNPSSTAAVTTAAPSNNIAAPLDNLLREAQDLLKDSRIAIYPVDIRGLRADPTYRADSAPPPPPPTGRGNRAAPPRPLTFTEKDAGEHAIMDAIADSTGGHAFYNTNGLKQAMDSAVHQGSEYYSLTYAPSNPKEDGGERRIKVVLDKPGYHLTYRERYLAPDAAHPAPVRPLVQDMNMQHGAPDSSELFFEAKVFPVGGEMPASPAETASMKPFAETLARIHRSKLDTGTPVGSQIVQHYGIDLAIIGRALEMPATGNGKHATDMSFGLAAYTQDGELLNGSEISVKNSISQAQFEKIEAEGYHASMVFTVPRDATSLRIGVRDEIGNRIGTMEVPLPIAAVPSSLPTAAPAK